jgi:hypothetical protein
MRRIRSLALALFMVLAFASPTRASVPTVDPRTDVDHDGVPIPQPKDWEPNFWGHQFREGIIEPLSHAFDIPDKMLFVARTLGADTRREAVNVNAFDEVPNSTWFTNRNLLRAIPVADLAQGPDSSAVPAKPWTIKHAKAGGASAGFQIKDADGKKWLVKLDPRDHPQLSSGADMVARTLVHAAGYNVPHNQPIRFARGDVLTAGYSGTPLAQKLSLKDGLRVWFDAMPDSVLAEIAMPTLVRLPVPEPGLDAARIFVTDCHDMAAKLAMPRPLIDPTGCVWVSWPKRASKVATDITEDPSATRSSPPPPPLPSRIGSTPRPARSTRPGRRSSW